LLLLVLAGVVAVAAMNWSVFLAPAELWLGFGAVSLPLGLVLLGLVGLVAALFLVFVVYLQGTVLLDARRHTKELQAHRELADKAEASRFTELRTFLAAELARQEGAQAEAQARVIARIDRMEQESRTFAEQSGNTLAAYIGELEDRLERRLDPPVAPRSLTGL